ncbi:MAG: hypothetical protein PF690_15320 [Deltaproteobacteria bacterium]|nr:hypothetical protein [Deltaproteobacteria bacterium]
MGIFKRGTRLWVIPDTLPPYIVDRLLHNPNFPNFGVGKINLILGLEEELMLTYCMYACGKIYFPP